MADLQHFLKIYSEEVKDGRRRDLIVDRFEDVELEGFNVINCELAMGNLLKNHLHFQRVDVFVLARYEHGCHSNNVQITDLSRLLLSLEVAVEERGCQEECLVVTLEVSQHFNHPINHASSQSWRDFMPHQAILSEKLLFELPCVRHDRVTILIAHINVLSLDLIGCLAGEVQRRMRHSKVRKDHISVNHVGLADMDRLETVFTKVALLLLLKHILLLAVVWNAREVRI